MNERRGFFAAVAGLFAFLTGKPTLHGAIERVKWSCGSTTGLVDFMYPQKQTLPPLTGWCVDLCYYNPTDETSKGQYKKCSAFVVLFGEDDQQGTYQFIVEGDAEFYDLAKPLAREHDEIMKKLYKEGEWSMHRYPMSEMPGWLARKVVEMHNKLGASIPLKALTSIDGPGDKKVWM